MASEKGITGTIKTRFAHVRERAGLMAQALKARAEIAATRRRLRGAYADLGEEVYGRIVASSPGPWSEDSVLQEFRVRIDGVKAEVRQREKALERLLEKRAENVAEGAPEPARQEAAVPPDAKPQQRRNKEA